MINEASTRSRFLRSYWGDECLIEDRLIGIFFIIDHAKRDHNDENDDERKHDDWVHLIVDAYCDDDRPEEAAKLSHSLYDTCTYGLDFHRERFGKHHHKHRVWYGWIIGWVLPKNLQRPTMISEPMWLSWRGLIKNSSPKSAIVPYVKISPFLRGIFVIDISE